MRMPIRLRGEISEMSIVIDGRSKCSCADSESPISLARYEG
jgi:hypothetical protein